MRGLSFFIYSILLSSFTFAQKDSTFTYYEMNDTFIIKYHSYIDTLPGHSPFPEEIYKRSETYRNDVLINKKTYDIQTNILLSDFNFSNDTSVQYSTYFPEGMLKSTLLKISQSESVYCNWYKNGTLVGLVKSIGNKYYSTYYYPSGFLSSDFNIDFNKNKSFELKSYYDFSEKLEIKEYFKSLKYYKGDSTDYSKLNTDFKMYGYFPSKPRSIYDANGSIIEKEFFKNGIPFKIYKYSGGKKYVVYINN